MAKTGKSSPLVVKAQGIFDYLRNSKQYSAWVSEARQAYGLYDGTGHWTQEELEELAKRGQAPTVINKFKPKIDSLAGVEIQTRTQITYRPRNSAPAAEKAALAFTYLATYHQDRLDLVQYNSESFKDGLIGGMGWAEMDSDGKEVLGGWLDPFEMLWDVDDTSPDMSNQHKMARYRWVATAEAIKRFPEHKAKIESMAQLGKGEDDLLTGVPSAQPAGTDYQGISGANFSYFDEKTGMVCFVEVMYKELKTVYKTITENGMYAIFMDRKDAVANRQKGAKIEECEELVNKFIVYMDDTLLDKGICYVQGKHFSYIPWCYARGRLDRVPYGLARAARYPQIEYNKRRSKALHLLNARQVIMDANAVESITELRAEAARPDGIIKKKPGADLQIVDNQALEASQVNLMGISTQELAECMGVFDELMGQQTNTVSGVAQDRRQEASVRTHAFAFSLLKVFKKRVGEALLQAMQATYTGETHVRIPGASQEEGQVIRLNAVDTAGNKQNNTAGLLFDIYVEQVPEFKSVPEEEAARLEQILMNGAGQYLAVPQIAKMLGFREPEKVAEAIKSLLAPSQPQADGASPQAGGVAAEQPSLPQA